MLTGSSLICLFKHKYESHKDLFFCPNLAKYQLYGWDLIFFDTNLKFYTSWSSLQVGTIYEDLCIF